jgi:ketosteroid isomerase-like protein
MKNLAFTTFLFLSFLSCETKNNNDLIEKWKKEILESEENFAKVVQEEGIHNAFVAYAADDAVLMRNNTVIKGKKAIDEHYKGVDTKSLTWTADFIEVSSSGDLGYTYGTYHYTFNDSLGNEQVDTGIFHTVWKRQSDGSWKFVWD